MPIIDRDRGFKALVKRVGKMARSSGILTVGIHDDAGTTGGLAVATVATFHEFGLGNNPERSFLRSWFDAKQASIAKQMTQAERAVVKGLITQEQAINRLGLRFVGEIQAKIASGIPPANAPSTAARKGSSTPLIDTGQLRSSVSHKVE